MIQIQLDKQVGSFFPGEMISGRIMLFLEEPKDCKCISITFEGKARVSWTETETRTRQRQYDSDFSSSSSRTETETVSVPYRSDENYFCCKVVVLGRHDGKETIQLPIGQSFYPFRFTLPINLPSSFESDTGKVSYFMTARVSRSWFKFDLSSVRPFTVNGLLDLNFEPGVAQRVVLRKDKSPGWFCCSKGPVGFNLTLPRTGFVPGEAIPFVAEITNFNNDTRVQRATFKLVQVASFHAGGKTKKKESLVSVVAGPGVASGSAETWMGQGTWRIPPIPPTRLAGCHIIDVQYRLDFELELSGLTFNLNASCPVVIGTIPLRATFSDLMPPPVTKTVEIEPGWESVVTDAEHPGYNPPPPQFPSGPAGPSAPTDFTVPSAPILETYPNLPPPTYAEATGQDLNQPMNPSGQNGGYENKLRGYGMGEPQAESGSSAPESDQPPEYDFLNDHGFVPNYVSYGFKPNPK